jgi:integrase
MSNDVKISFVQLVLMTRSSSTATENPFLSTSSKRAFKQIREHAGLHRQGGPRCQPRLHDLRHSSAVHRLTMWYREGENVQKLLPQLSVYMGHTHLAATQVYLTMTPELLHEASVRFERYATSGGGNE